MIRGEPAPSRDGSSAQTADDAAIAEGKAASATTWVSLISAMRRYRRFLLVVALTSLLAIVTLAPNFTRPMVLDEVEFIEAARGIQTYGVPVYYHGYSTSAGWTLIGQDNVRGLGPSTIYTTPDGFITAVEHGADFDAIANWHPELYLYILALFLHLPVAPEVAARLLNLLCLVASALLIYGVARQLVVRLGAGARWQFMAPLAAALLYELHPLTTRGSQLIDFTATLSVTTVLLFWFLRLRYNDTNRGLAAQVLAFALVPWSNLGPFPALVAAMGLILLLAMAFRHWREGLRSLVVVGGGTALFYVSYDLYSLWSGIPASLTLDHSAARVNQVLALVPYPLNWQHFGAQRGSFALWALTAAAPLAAALALYFAGRLRMLPRTRTWVVVVAVVALGGSLAISAVLAALYGNWQDIGMRDGVVIALSSWLALLRFFRAGWMGVAHLEWLAAALALCVALLVISAISAARPTTRVHAQAEAAESHGQYVLAEMLLFCLVLGVDLLFLAAQAWGFPKYDAPIIAVCFPLCAIFAFAIIHRRQESRPAAALSLIAGAVVLALLVGRSGSIPFTYRLGGLAAVAVLLAGALACVASDDVAAWLGSARVDLSSSAKCALLYAPVIVLALAAPLALSTLTEAIHLPAERGSLTYVEGTSWGVRDAGLYLQAHVRPSDQLVLRKDIAFYAGMPYFDDFPWTLPLHVEGSRVIWTARVSSPGPGFVEVWSGPEFNVYKYTPQGQHP